MTIQSKESNKIIDRALSLLEQIIEKAHIEDSQHKAKMIKAHKGSQAVGESWTCFHLKILKQILKGEN